RRDAATRGRLGARGDGRAARVAVVLGPGRVPVGADSAHRRTLLVFVEAVSSDISSIFEAPFLRRTVPVSASSISTTFLRREVISSLPVWSASWTARPSFDVATSSWPA